MWSLILFFRGSPYQPPWLDKRAKHSKQRTSLCDILMFIFEDGMNVEYENGWCQVKYVKLTYRCAVHIVHIEQCLISVLHANI